MILVLAGLWVGGFLFFGVNLDDPKESLMYRLGGALMLLAWPLLVIYLAASHLSSRR